MIDINEINAEIERLENSDTTYHNISRLAQLYEVRAHLHEDKAEKSADGLAKVFDTHMTAVKAVFPVEYDKIMKKIKELSGQ